MVVALQRQGLPGPVTPLTSANGVTENDMAQQILLAHADSTEAQRLGKNLEGWGFQVLFMEGLEADASRLCDAQPGMAIVDADLPSAEALAEAVAAADPEAVIAVLCTRGHAETAMARLRRWASEYLVQPVSAADLEIVVSRMQRIRHQAENAAGADRRIEERARELAAQTVDTERLLGIRQIVDKMYAFIGQVASDVQGGVKYFNELPYFVSIHSPRGEVLAANPTYLKYLGNRVGKNSWEIYSGKRKTFEACPVGATVRTGQVMATRALVRYASGARVPVVVHTAPIHDNDGEVALVLEVFAGTKEIEQLAAEVRTTQQRYHQLFDAVPSYIAVVDRQLRLNAANRKFKEQFGGQAGGRFFDILRPASFPAHRDPVSITARDGVPHQGEMVVTAQDGAQYNMIAWTAPITTATGKLVQVLVIFTDITELRRLQDNLTSLGLMISTLSHNLKGSLTGLDAALYLIDQGFYRDTPGRIEEGLDVARLMVERIRKMVFDVLTYSKERELELTRVEMARFADEVAANVANRIRGANIEFHCNFDPSLGSFDIDRGLMRNALINILENAMEACIADKDQKAYRIEFSARAEGDDLVLEVVDNGCGMTPHQMKNMFTIFYTSKGHQGTGLGLFITDKIVRKHGGSITTDSAPGKGTRFEIRLPRKGRGDAGSEHRRT